MEAISKVLLVLLPAAKRLGRTADQALAAPVEVVRP